MPCPMAAAESRRGLLFQWDEFALFDLNEKDVAIERAVGAEPTRAA